MGWFRGMDTSLYGRGNGYSTIACNPISTDAIYPIYHTLLSGALSTPAGARSLNARFNRVCATVPAPGGAQASWRRVASHRVVPDNVFRIAASVTRTASCRRSERDSKPWATVRPSDLQRQRERGRKKRVFVVSGTEGFPIIERRPRWSYLRPRGSATETRLYLVLPLLPPDLLARRCSLQRNAS